MEASLNVVADPSVSGGNLLFNVEMKNGLSIMGDGAYKGDGQALLLNLDSLIVAWGDRQQVQLRATAKAAPEATVPRELPMVFFFDLPWLEQQGRLVGGIIRFGELKRTIES